MSRAVLVHPNCPRIVVPDIIAVAVHAHGSLEMSSHVRAESHVRHDPRATCVFESLGAGSGSENPLSGYVQPREALVGASCDPRGPRGARFVRSRCNSQSHNFTALFTYRLSRIPLGTGEPLPMTSSTCYSCGEHRGCVSLSGRPLILDQRCM